MATCTTSCDVCSGYDVLAACGPAASDVRPTRTRQGTARGLETLSDAASSLFQHLRKLRKAIADARGVPAYIVFSDATLVEMAEVRPRSLRSLQGISGVGPKKLEQYGAQFLAALRQPAQPSGPG